MARYLHRSCPKCGDYLGIIVPEPPEPVAEILVDAKCLRCGFKLNLGVIQGKNIFAGELSGRKPKQPLNRHLG